MELNRLLDKRIAVVGIGGVGGYLAAMLGRCCSHLTLGARGARRESILRDGLVLHSEYKGEIIVHPERVVPVAEIGEQDYIFICVKNYSLEEVCRDLKSAVTDDTVIIPVMNGVDPGERIRTLLGKGTVVDSLIYIVAFANEDYSITQQGNYANLWIGSKDTGDNRNKIVSEVSEILSKADVDHRIADDIEAAVWKKYILNCAYNAESAYYDNTIGELRSDQEKAKEYEALVNEAFQVALTKGVHVEQRDVDAIIHRFYFELADNATSSLQRDIRKGKQAEVETFSGYIVREGRKLGVVTPVTEKMYEGLKMK